MLLLALIALQSAAVQPGEMRIFEDWAVGCDNGRHCQAVSLVPGHLLDQPRLVVSVRRGPGAADEPVVTFDGDDLCGATLSAGGQPLPVRILTARTCEVVHPGDVASLLTALRSESELRAADAAGAPAGAVSLAGVSAALLYMDEAQRRVGTVTALVRPGSAPASQVPPPPPLPRVRAAPEIDSSSSIEVSDERIAELRREVGCTIDEVGGPEEVAMVHVEVDTLLILLSCGSGAYNLTSLPFIAERRGDAVTIAPAPFDSQWALAEQGQVSLINAEWDYGRRTLSEFGRARGLGDCGTKADYVWDGESFRLVRQEVMDDCRGATDFITVWRAQVVRD